MPTPDDTSVTLGELYRLLERVERKIDETNTYAHTQNHDLRGILAKMDTRVELVRVKTDNLVLAIKEVDGRVDRIYQHAAILAAAISSTIWAALQLITSWWATKH